MSIRRSWTQSPFVLLLFSIAGVLLAGCAVQPAATGGLTPVAQNSPQQAAPPPGIQPLDPAAPLATATPGEATAAPDAEAPSTPEPPLVTVKNRSVNVRSGPGTDFQVVTGAAAGDVFTTTGKVESGWWRICCLPGAGDAEQPAWISERVVTPNPAAEALPPLEDLFPQDLTATWSVDYFCGSERCAVKQCSAVVRAEVRDAQDPRWLEIDRTVTWEDACGENSSWLHQIDRIDGKERYENSTGLFLFEYWIGAHPGEPNAIFVMDDGQKVQAWCSPEQESEVEEEGGWTTVYKGSTCHDVRTGMLVSMQYTKRWLFTGEFEGERYERAYFGDYETYSVKLTGANVRLALMEGDETPAPEEATPDSGE